MVIISCGTCNNSNCKLLNKLSRRARIVRNNLLLAKHSSTLFRLHRTYHVCERTSFKNSSANYLNCDDSKQLPAPSVKLLVHCIYLIRLCESNQKQRNKQKRTLSTPVYWTRIHVVWQRRRRRRHSFDEPTNGWGKVVKASSEIPNYAQHSTHNGRQCISSSSGCICYSCFLLQFLFLTLHIESNLTLVRVNKNNNK